MLDGVALVLNDRCTDAVGVITADCVTEFNAVDDTDATIECVSDGEGDTVAEESGVRVVETLPLSVVTTDRVEFPDSDAVAVEENKGVDVIVTTLLTEGVVEVETVVEIEPVELLLIAAVELMDEE